MYIFPLITLLFSITTVVGNLQTISIIANDLSSNKINIGSIEYDSDKPSARYTKNEDSHIVLGKYCIGTTDLEHMDCFAYVELGDETQKSISRQFHLYLKQDNSIDYMAYPISQDNTVKISYSQEAPVPNLHPANKQQEKGKKEPKKTIVKKKIEDEDGNIVEIEDEEIVDERSWIQKNWIYVVIPLVIYLISTDEKNKKTN